jgi:hypothetical protein
VSTWEQKPEPKEQTTWMEGARLRRAVIQNALIGWRWVRQSEFLGTWSADLYSGHWAPTEKCAERSARRHAKRFKTAPRIVTLNEDDLR